MCSRGSVIPLFIEQIKAGKPITITDPEMTRFLMSLEEAVDLVMFAFENGRPGDIMVQKAPACTVGVLAEAIRQIFNDKNEIHYIGIRHGEKIYETLLTKEECLHAEDMGNFFRVPADNRDLNYEKYYETGIVEPAKIEEFRSDNTKLLNVEEVKEKLLKLDYVQRELEAR
jgi:UDP-glucose 4-epimerase